MRWRARTIVQHYTAQRASRPQLKRDPLGRTQRDDLVPPSPDEQANLLSKDALLSLTWTILRGLLLLAGVDAGTHAVMEHSWAAFIIRLARDAIGAIVISFAFALPLQVIRADWQASRPKRRP